MIIIHEVFRLITQALINKALLKRVKIQNQIKKFKLLKAQYCNKKSSLKYLAKKLQCRR